ncbi:hypothetical protein [Myroides guanonis]|uniref:Outer membrane protein beta-barrel domain-containing protein n=1 Tax=Myroides guanonis TaxID=1150112 RepID=A0A1I3L3C6_9FLAO|nr:hypothetical protein [Myroides guanonis]SFI79189.1 hypothetical protein SAMN04487893_101159 [Myroides guanonis]
MKKSIILIALLTGLFVLNTQAQDNKKSFLDRTRFEFGVGVNFPSEPREGVEVKNYAGVGSLYCGAIYELNDLWGVRGTYAYNKFENKEDVSMGSLQHKFVAEVMFDVVGAIAKQKEQRFELYLHSGAGLSIGRSELKSGTDMMGAFQVGILPNYKISDAVRVHLDLVYVTNFKQDYGYHGGSAKFNGKSATGSYLIANIGIAVQL